MTDLTRAEIETLLADVADTDPSGAWFRRATHDLHAAAPDLARQLLDALDRIEDLEASRTDYEHPIDIAGLPDVDPTQPPTMNLSRDER